MTTVSTAPAGAATPAAARPAAPSTPADTAPALPGAPSGLRSATRPAPLIVISGGAAEEPPSPDFHADARRRLARALPAARRVLQVGGSDDRLQDAHRSRHPDAEWHRLSASGVPAHLPGGRFDLIVLPDDLLARHAEPLALLQALATVSQPDTRLLLDAANRVRPELLQQMALGDLSDTDSGVLARGPLRHGSPASLYKLLMDAGWMPHLVDACSAGAPADRATQAMWQWTDAQGIPRATALRIFGTERLIVEARRSFPLEDEPPGVRLAARQAGHPLHQPGLAPLFDPGDVDRSAHGAAGADVAHHGAAAASAPAAGRFSVVVPTTREPQLRLNIELSPGLREVGARVVSVRHASDPADALERAEPWLDADWVLLCHQDIYFPAGFGLRLQRLLAAIPAAERERTLIGFAGMAADAQTRRMRQAGFVIDRLHRFDQPASPHGVSIDELALVVSRHSLHRIDPALGWHLWATDLCLAAITRHQAFAQIVRLPLFHNSLNDFQLPADFHRSALALAAKYPDFGPIHTLCGVIDAGFLARSRQVLDAAASH